MRDFAKFLLCYAKLSPGSNYGGLESQMEQGLRSGDIVTGMYPHDVALLLKRVCQ